jgi:hypothetical protein
MQGHPYHTFYLYILLFYLPFVFYQFLLTILNKIELPFFSFFQYISSTNNSTMTSFYISRLNFHTTEMALVKLFSEFGQVDKVEFILPNTEENNVKSALICISDLTQKGLHAVQCISHGEDYKLYFNNTEYCSISFAQNTSINNAENCRYLEEKIESQGNTITELITRLHNTESRIEELENIVYKLINNIFEPDNSVSTHSSMPSLVEDDSVSTHSSMPSLVEDEDDEDEDDEHEDDEHEDDEHEDEDEEDYDDNSTQSSLTWLEDDCSNSSVPPLIDEYGNIIE